MVFQVKNIQKKILEIYNRGTILIFRENIIKETCNREIIATNPK
jgi:hypothetical protein